MCTPRPAIRRPDERTCPITHQHWARVAAFAAVAALASLLAVAFGADRSAAGGVAGSAPAGPGSSAGTGRSGRAAASPTSVPASPAAASDRYLAPDGSDSAAGTLAAPWRSLAGAQKQLRPGDTLWVRGGTYRDLDVSWTASGTVAAPISVRAYPGERPVFDGDGSEGRFLWLHEDAGWIVLRDLVVTGFASAHTGIIVLTDGAHDVTLAGLEVRGNVSGTQLDHLVYLGAPGVHDVTIEGCLLASAPGAAIHVYHEPAARSIRILDNEIEGSHWGVLLYSGTSDVLVRGNRFVDVDVAVKLERATGVRLIGNEASGRDGIVVVGPPVEAEYADEGNRWPRAMQLQAP